nr:MAG TPA: hypothetical protein [Caudoviricetes sp.]
MQTITVTSCMNVYSSAHRLYTIPAGMFLFMALLV